MLNVKNLLVSSITTLSAGSLFAASLTLSPKEIREVSPQPGFNYEIGDIVLPPFNAEPDVISYTSRGHYYKQALTSTKPRITSSEKFITIPGAKTHINVPPGYEVLVNLAFTAESRCNEPGSTAPDWCEVRLLVGGVEASPQASLFGPDTYAFDSTDQGTESISSWESHAMDRHRCVDNSKGSTTLTVPIEAQWKVTNFDGGAAPDFWLDDWSFTVQLAKGCRQERINLED